MLDCQLEPDDIFVRMSDDELDEYQQWLDDQAELYLLEKQ